MNLYKTACIITISIVVGMSIRAVGTESDMSSNLYPWYLPLYMFIIICAPAFLAYHAGKHDEREEVLIKNRIKSICEDWKKQEEKEEKNESKYVDPTT